MAITTTISGSSMNRLPPSAQSAGGARTAAGRLDPASAQAGAGHDMSIQLGLLRLARWPVIPLLRTEDMADMSRLCALLARRDTAAPIIPRILGIPRERVQSLLLALQTDGCLTVLGQSAGGNAASATADSAAREAEDPSEQELPQASFISKLWKRLLTVN